MFESWFIAALAIALVVVVIITKTAVIVPQNEAFVVERLGRFHQVLEAGFHILLPFVDRIAYRRSLKEEVFDIASQRCVTKDNVSIEIDGIIYLQIMDPARSAYGISNYVLAATQLAQTALRSAIGKIDLDKTFEERENLNGQVVAALEEASVEWGIKVKRYEIKDIVPPESIMNAMEAQVKAEREKRAAIHESEGRRQSAINISEGERMRAINESEGEKQRRINEAEGRAKEIEMVALATASGLATVARALATDGGLTAANLRLAEQYIGEFGKLAKEGNSLIVPASLSEPGGMVAALMSILKPTGTKQP